MSGYTGFTAEWLAERERKRVQKIGAAKAWNGSVDTKRLDNVEFVTVTGGGVESRHADLYGNRPAAGESDSRVSAPNICRGTVGSKPGQAKSSPAAGVASGPPTHIAGAPTRKDGVRGVREPRASTPAPLVLPWPPTGNTAVRHVNGAHYLRPEVTTYRQTVAERVARSAPISGQYHLCVELSPPDRRTRDIDNVLKSLLDALVKAKWLPSDSMAYMRQLTVTVRPDFTGTVYVRALTDREAA